MNELVYRLPLLMGVLRHSDTDVALARDGEYDGRRQITLESRLDAEVRSGDYFVTLATTLDSLSSRLDDYGARVVLEGVVSDLIYLQDNYTINKTDQSK